MHHLFALNPNFTRHWTPIYLNNYLFVYTLSLTSFYSRIVLATNRNIRLILARSDCVTLEMDGLIHIVDLPRDKEDPTYVKAFSCVDVEDLEQAVEFFNDFGFVVISSVFTPEECSATRDAMWEILEAANPDFKHDDYSTWDKLKSKGSYGLSMRGPSFHPTLVNNRQNPKLAKVLHALITSTSPLDPELVPDNSDEAGSISDLMVSHDRFTVYRATVLPTEATHDIDTDSTGKSVDASQYSTGDRNIHLDMNPWWWLEASTDVTDGVATLQYKYTAPAAPVSPAAPTLPSTAAATEDVRASIEQQPQQPSDVVASEKKVETKKSKKDKQAAAGNDNPDFIRENNLVVKSMGRHVQCVLNFLPNAAEDGGTLIVPKFHTYLPEFCRQYAHLRKPLPWVQFPAEVEAPLLQRAHRIPMREGSVLIWDQRVAHGTAPNQSSTCRMAQYMKAFLRSKSFPTAAVPINITQKTDGVTSSSDSNGSACGKDSVSTEDRQGVVDGKQECKAESARLRRRSEALQQLLVQNHARDLVSPLGETLFGLDIL